MKKIKMIVVAGVVLAMALSMVSCGNKGGASEYENGEALLGAVYNTYSEEDKLPVCGGNGENGNPEGPGAFTLDNGEEFETVTGFPADYIENVSDAATMMHLMNANNLTAAAFKFDGDTNAMIDAYTKSIDDKSWLCGAPETFVLMKADGYIISVFGENGMVDSFVKYTEGLIENTEVVVNQPVTE